MSMVYTIYCTYDIFILEYSFFVLKLCLMKDYNSLSGNPALNLSRLAQVRKLRLK